METSIKVRLEFDHREDTEAAIAERLEKSALTPDELREITQILQQAGQRAPAILKALETVNPTVQDSGTPAPEISPEQLWLGHLKSRFNSLPQLHKGVQWIDVEKSLKADPESMRKLQILDEKGHSMNVFGEEKGEFIFASGWNNDEQVSADHRNIVFDKKAEDQMCNGNATDIAKELGVDLADTKLHEQLIRAIQVNGWAWLKTDEATRKVGIAFNGNHIGVSGNVASDCFDNGSFRAALRVKKVD